MKYQRLFVISADGVSEFHFVLTDVLCYHHQGNRC